MSGKGAKLEQEKKAMLQLIFKTIALLSFQNPSTCAPCLLAYFGKRNDKNGGSDTKRTQTVPKDNIQETSGVFALTAGNSQLRRKTLFAKSGTC